MRRVDGWDFVDTSTVTVHVRRLRQKIELEPRGCVSRGRVAVRDAYSS